jgi:acetyl esterase/lipase
MKVERIYLKEYFPELGANGCNAYVDCYIPSPIYEMGEEMANKKYPCMVVCPGGGYGMTSEREADVIGTQFLAEQYRVFVVRYSVAPHSFPQQIREVAGAMELIYKYADEWNADTSKIAIVGFSAGGHLVAQYTNRYDCPEIREIFPESKPVQASILSYAVLTADPQYTHGGTVFNYVGGHTPISMEEKGCSCELLVTEKTPPTFLWHTAEDAAVPVENSLFYAKALRDHKLPFELHIYPYGPHGLATADELTYVQIEERNRRPHKWLEDVKSWLKLVGF